MSDQVQLIERQGVSIAVTDLAGDGPTVILLHGLAGSSRELLPTAQALQGHRVLLVDQRGHGYSTRRPADLSRSAFVEDIIEVMNAFAPGERCVLVGQSAGAHTAFLVAATYPERVQSLVLLEGHAGGNSDPEEAAGLGRWFASWPTPFAGEDAAREFLGDDAVVDAWIADFEEIDGELAPRFDADIMQHTLEAVHEPRWEEWEQLQVPTLAVFAADSMFTLEDQDELIRRRPATTRVNLRGGSHDAHLDAFDEWIDVLTSWLAT